MIEKDYLLRSRIEALRVLARTDEPNRAVLIERNIEDYLKTSGSEIASLERLRDAIEREEGEKRQDEDWSIAKDYVRSRLSWLA
jgi:siroheme synthase (precorrin-2 oxidase/ferrochelatase)